MRAPPLTVRRPSGPGPGRRVVHQRARRTRRHQQEPARLGDRTARRCELHHEAGRLRSSPARPKRTHHPHPRQELLPQLTSDGLRFAIFYANLVTTSLCRRRLLLERCEDCRYSLSRTSPSDVQASPAPYVWRSACFGIQQNPRHFLGTFQRGEVTGAGYRDALNVRQRVGHTVALGGP